MATKKFTRKEIAERGTSKDAVFVIDNIVYDVMEFLDEHPGGHEVLIGQAGRDASESFDDVGHSLDAKQLMNKYRVGELVDEDKVEVKKRVVTFEDTRHQGEDAEFFGSWKLALVVGLLITLIYTYLL